MAISKSTLYLLSIVLILTIVMTYFIHHSRQENFEDLTNDEKEELKKELSKGDPFFGILPKDKHPTRITNIIYYNDPIFLVYGENNFVKLTSNENALGTIKDALSKIAYLGPNRKIYGLTPVSYKESLYLNVYPKNEFSNKMNISFEIIPYTTPYNNQQPYLQINDVVSFRNEKGEYLSINPVTSELELLKSTSLPNTALFKISNSPQCYINYSKHGIDTRNQPIGTLSSIIDNMRKILDKEINNLGGDENKIRELEKKQVTLKEVIEKAQNSKDALENQISLLKQDYDSTINTINDNNYKLKLDVDKDMANRLQLVENVIDNNYLTLMKNEVKKGCS